MKLRLLALALVVCGGAAAQNPYIALQGADETSGGIVVSQPRTVLAVDVTAERDVTLSGPYARYAQKFLGVRAPLTDKMSWAVTGASVALLDPKACLDAPAPAQPSRTVMSHATSEDEFSRLQADKNDMTSTRGGPPPAKPPTRSFRFAGTVSSSSRAKPAKMSSAKG